MRWSVVGAGALVALMVGLLGLQIWLGQRQQELQRRIFAQHLELQETQRRQLAQQELQRRQLAQQHQAAQQRWRAEQAVPGQPWRPPPPQLPPPLLLPLPPPPILYLPPPTVPIFPFLYPGLMGLSLVMVQAQQRKIDKQCHAEEEDQTPYTEEELMQGWEFKIIRSPVGLFDRPAFLEHVLREEAVAGWLLLEKFDGTRVRLKRLPGPLNADLPLGYDPLRTTVGPRAQMHTLCFLIAAICLVLPVVFVVIYVFDPISWPVFAALCVVPLALAALFSLLAVRARARFRILTYEHIPDARRPN